MRSWRAGIRVAFLSLALFDTTVVRVTNRGNSTSGHIMLRSVIGALGPCRT